VIAVLMAQKYRQQGFFAMYNFERLPSFYFFKKLIFKIFKNIFAE